MPSNIPFQVPENSPWFGTIDGVAIYMPHPGDPEYVAWAFNNYANWPPHIQAEAAAVAAMEWECRCETIHDNLRKCEPCWNATKCRAAFAAARERMKGEAT